MLLMSGIGYGQVKQPAVSELSVHLPEHIADVPIPRFHLTGRPWDHENVATDEIVEAVEGLCRFAARQVNDDGAVIDPFLKREHQYSTPYFAAAVGALMHFQRAEDLWPVGIRAMDHATRCLAGGSDEIPDHHGEFFVTPLTGALEHYRGHVSRATYENWKRRLQTPLNRIMKNQHERINNWRTYAMKGEWIRVNHGLVPRETAEGFIQDAWIHRTQRQRILNDRWNFYQDWSSDPQSHAVEFVGRGNLLGLIESGYDGVFSEEITRLVERGSTATLLWQDASGQCPVNGRTDNHVFNDVLCMNTYDVMAERQWRAGQRELAGRFRQAADMSFRSIARWARTDGEWAGSYFVSKNHFAPEQRVGYQPASQYMNYNGAVMFHLAESALARRTQILRQPSPVEVGGYVVKADPRFGSVSASAGGMHLQANLRGDTVPKYGRYWSPLGIVRFSRVGWDSRLGPSDGIYDAELERGITCGPTWKRGSHWVRLAEVAEHYRGTLNVQLEHPLLVRFEILWHSITGAGGPTFKHEFVVTPDGVLVTLTSQNLDQFGLTLPLLENDGRPLTIRSGSKVLSVEPPPENERQSPKRASQSWIVLSDSEQVSGGESSRSTYGFLKPVRLEADDGTVQVFVYPWKDGDVSPSEVSKSWTGDSRQFQSDAGRVEPTMYVGRTVAGGMAKELDIDADGRSELFFAEECSFVAQISKGRITAIEADRSVDVTLTESGVASQLLHLDKYAPIEIDVSARPAIP